MYGMENDEMRLNQMKTWRATYYLLIIKLCPCPGSNGTVHRLLAGHLEASRPAPELPSQHPGEPGEELFGT